MSQFHYIPKGKAARQLAAATSLPDAKPETRPSVAMTPTLAAYFERQKTNNPNFIPSVEQQAYFDWIKFGKGSLLLSAVAGAGKSTTLVQGLRYMSGSVFLGAFGKDAATDLQAKAHKAAADRQGIHISTMHAAGYFAWRTLYPRAAVDGRKVNLIIDNFASGHADRLMIDQSKNFIASMVSFGKQFLIGCEGHSPVDNMAEWLRLCEHFSADQALPDNIKTPAAMEWVMTVFSESNRKCSDIIDFDDMLYAPILFNAKVFKNDWVLGDEWQDCNPARREMARRMLKPNGRGVFVGDDRQSIFGFTGASHDSLELTEKMFNCQRLGLSVTYRCPKAVVVYVKAIIDPEYAIQAHPNAIEGDVRQVNYNPTILCPVCKGIGITQIRISSGVSADAQAGDSNQVCWNCQGNRFKPTPPWFMQDEPTNEDAVLCRYTKPLIATAYAMIKDGIACKVEGRDIGLGLIKLARLWRITSINLLEERLKAYLKREIEKATLAGSERREQEVIDRVGTLRIFIERCNVLGKRSIDELVAEIEALFADKVRDVITLSTGHKAKGREWPRVYWLQTGQRGHISKEWEIKSERNVKIVISTRPLKELILVPESVHSKDEKRKS